jgi:thioredoxin 1
MMLREITEEEYYNTYHNTITVDKKPSILYAFTTWCSPCKTLSPIMEELSEKFPAIQMLKVNAGESKRISMDNKIKTVPTLLLFKNGIVVEKITGHRERDQLFDIFKKLLV